MKKAWIFCCLSLLLNVMVILVSRNSVYFSEFYALNIYPVFSFLTVRITSLFPFSVIEILLGLLIVISLIGFGVFILSLIKKRGMRKKILIKSACILLSFCSFTFLLYNLGCGINYQRHPFSYYSELSVTGYNDETLLAVIDEFIEKLEVLSAEITTSDLGAFTMDEKKLSSVSRESMAKLGEKYECLNTYYPNPKPVILSNAMSRALICGIFSPFTFEANYNNDMPLSEKPFTICHELSHLSGFMREDEANFIAFLACRESGDIDFLYSGYVSALVYSIIAYGNSASDSEYLEMYSYIPAQVKTELELRNVYWRPFRNTAISKTANAVNDAYLKANSQQDGTKSYGRFVDLLIADYLAS